MIELKNSTRYIWYGVVIALIIAAGLFWYFAFFDTDDEGIVQTSGTNESETRNIEEAAENDSQTDEAYLRQKYGKIDTLFGKCDIGLERKAIDERLACISQDPKAQRFWRDMQTAQMEVRAWLLKKDTKPLSTYLSCDAYDLTWYEMHCEADRTRILAEHLNFFLAFLDKSDKGILQESAWIQRKPDKRLFRNPKWILRSRLVNKQFKLIGPWKQEPHPTESGTLIMLEQNLDGKIYITGIPLTGTYDEQ
ncbi:MAG: hypothetical protein HQ517_07935 [SAR324 cluster bacterium]|nr:hypothetical protein [SAR324 cluster bacterium]